jgi:predicted phosphodiesterase
MRVAIISDIHGNRQAFNAVLTDIAESSIEEVWCLGDLVGYGAEPNACVELARENTAVCLAGNHDLAVVGTVPLEDFSRAASTAVRWTQGVIEQEQLAFLAELAPSGARQAVGLYHASPRDPVWEYVISSLLADVCLDVQADRVCLVGHSHVALSFQRPDGGATTGELHAAGNELDISSGEWLLNPGSVGQPRDGDPRAAWLMIDLDEQLAQYRRCEYDIAGAAAAIRAADLPESLAERLEYGQ